MKSTKDVKVDTPQKKQPLKQFFTRNLPRPKVIKQADRKGSKIVVTTRSLARFKREAAAKKDLEKRALAKKQKAAARAKAAKKKKKAATKTKPVKPKKPGASTNKKQSKNLTK